MTSAASEIPLKLFQGNIGNIFCFGKVQQNVWIQKSWIWDTVLRVNSSSFWSKWILSWSDLKQEEKNYQIGGRIVYVKALMKTSLLESCRCWVEVNDSKLVLSCFKQRWYSLAGNRSRLPGLVCCLILCEALCRRSAERGEAITVLSVSGVRWVPKDRDSSISFLALSHDPLECTSSYSPCIAQHLKAPHAAR